MMYQVITKLKSATPYSQSRHYLTDKKPKESAKDYEERTWRDRMHVNDDGYVFIPPMSFKNCLDECAKYLSKQIPGKGKSTYTKHVEAGVLVMDPLVLPIKARRASGRVAVCKVAVTEKVVPNVTIRKQIPAQAANRAAQLPIRRVD